MNNTLLSLLHLTDPTLPIGGFSHSAGLETYVQKGIVHDVATARQFIEAMLSQNVHFNDAAFVSLAFDADFDTILALDAECTAVKLPREMRQASQKLGLRLLKIFEPLTNAPLSKTYFEAIKKQEAVGHYCLIFALMAQSLGISKQDTLTGFYYNAAVGMVTNAVKLVPLSQQKGQEILFSLHDLITELADKVVERDWVGLCCTGFDLRSMQHERLYSRLYMS
ncbi:MAG: urease accessory protein UreF [Saprospiraceae bacterium]|nr:urease accessory protein UreF [Saprospiraceae bacterium]